MVSTFVVETNDKLEMKSPLSKYIGYTENHLSFEIRLFNWLLNNIRASISRLIITCYDLLIQSQLVPNPFKLIRSVP